MINLTNHRVPTRPARSGPAAAIPPARTPGLRPSRTIRAAGDPADGPRDENGFPF